MEDLLNFKEDRTDHWHASYDTINFDISHSDKDYELKVEGRDVHKTLHFSSLEEAKESAKKFLVW